MKACEHFIIMLVSGLSVSAAQTTTVTVIALHAYPGSPKDGERITLACQSTGYLGEIVWNRNSKQVFNTNGHSVGFNGNDWYKAYSENFTSEFTRTKHNVTFLFNSTWDDRAVWNCGSGSIYSNNVTITEFTPTTSVGIVTTDDETTNNTRSFHSAAKSPTTMNTEADTDKQRQEETTSNVVYIAVGVCTAVVIVAILAVLLVLLRKKRRQVAENQQIRTEGETVYENKDGYEEMAIENPTSDTHPPPTYLSPGDTTPKQTRKQVTFTDDVYAQVDKTKKTQQLVQLEDSIESLYAKPIKTKKKTLSKASSNIVHEKFDDTAA